MSKKKIIIIIVIVILIIMLILPKNSKEIRIRVLSNSNSEADLEIKKEVWDGVIKLLERVELNDLEKDLNDLIPEIENIVNKISPNTNNDVKICMDNFEPKSLNGKIVFGGTYKTLLISLGNAKGSNYWSLLYPEYYDIKFEDINSSEVKYRFYIIDKLNDILSK